MTSRERLLAVLHGEIPDCVPCCPDISNMVPCRLTGKPFWDIYAFRDPPLWKAHMDALKRFDLDGGFEVNCPVDIFADGTPSKWEARVVHRRDDGSFVTRRYHLEKEEWAAGVTLFPIADSPARTSPEKLKLPEVPTEWEPLEGVKEWPTGIEAWDLFRKEMGDQGIMGLPSGASTLVLQNEEDIYSYYEDPEPWRRKVQDRLEAIDRRMERIAALEHKPDLLFCGGSGTLIFQTPEIFRDLGLPLLKRATERAADLGIPTHVHSCGPEAKLVEIAAEETALTIIDPLEVPPMGNCILADLKKRYGDKIILKGNLHTTDVMLNGSVDDVVAASKKAIDDAGKDGGFILSTGDQCGRDTPDENLYAMVETARTYGKY